HVIALDLVLVQQQLEAGVHELRELGLIDELTRPVSALISGEYAPRFPHVVDPAALRRSTLHHYRDRKRGLFHGGTIRRICYDFSGKNTMVTKVIPIRVNGAPSAAKAAVLPFSGGSLSDTRGRPMRDLRISVTDRCNFRCTYCMP